MKRKYTILSALINVLPWLVVALWMMYGWYFMDIGSPVDDFEVMVVALVMLVAGTITTLCVRAYEGRDSR